MDSADELLALEAQMRAPDAVMEPGMADVVARYMRAGGKPADVIESLMAGYEGYAQMASLVCGWLALVDAPYVPPGAIGPGGTGGGGGAFDAGPLVGLASAVGGEAAAGVGASGVLLEAGGNGRGASGLPGDGGRPQGGAGVGSAAAGTAAAASGSVSGSAAGGSGPSSSAAAAATAAAAAAAAAVAPPDEFTLLAELARERFDPEAVLAVFRAGRPGWLHELTADARGRRLILELSARHRGSIFLNYAIRRIFDTGHADEVAAVGASALSSYFEVFHRLLARSLEAAAAATTTTQLERLSRDMAEACAAGQHTYAHAQHLLSHLAAWGAGAEGAEGAEGEEGPFRRLSQELEAAACARHDPARVWAMQPLFVPRDAPPRRREAARLVSSALVQGLGGDAKGGTRLALIALPLSQLLDLCGGGGGGGASSLLTKSEDGAAARATLSALRHPKMLQLLMEGMFSWESPASPAVQRTAAQLLALAATGPGALHTTISPDEARSCLESARALAARAAAGERLPDEDLAAVRSAAASLTLAALGLLHFAGGWLARAEAYDDDRCIAAVPALVALLRSVAAAQPQHVPAVARALADALTAMGARRADLAQAVVGALAALVLEEGAPVEALAAAEAWAARRADPSLIRAFLLCVLDGAAPPYSREFARPLVRLARAGKVAATKNAGMLGLPAAVDRLRDFAIECLDAVDFAPPLSEAEVDMLERLAA